IIASPFAAGRVEEKNRLAEAGLVIGAVAAQFIQVKRESDPLERTKMMMRSKVGEAQIHGVRSTKCDLFRRICGDFQQPNKSLRTLGVRRPRPSSSLFGEPC